MTSAAQRRSLEEAIVTQSANLSLCSMMPCGSSSEADPSSGIQRDPTETEGRLLYD